MSRRSVIRRARRAAWDAMMAATPLDSVADEVRALSRAASDLAGSLRVPARWRALFLAQYLRSGLAAHRAFEAWS